MTKEEEKTEQPQEEQEEIQQQQEEDKKDEQIRELEEQVQQYKDKLQRTHADFENFKKRSEKERQQFVKYANEGVILNMLEVYEDLERALQVEDDKDLREGVELIYRKFTKTLRDEGVEQIQAEGEMFDPYKHEALLTEKNEDFEDNQIIQDLQKGYTLNSKVIRYSKVKVCKN